MPSTRHGPQKKETEGRRAKRAVFRAIPNNQIDAAGSSPLECGGLTPLFLVAA